MSVDIVKQLDRAKRFVEKNRLDDAIEAYRTVLGTFPNHLESIQYLGDLYTMQNRPDQAAIYYGMLFDRFTAPREEPKALALYARFLKSQQQPPERVARYALMLQKQNRAEEAIEQFMSAADAAGYGSGQCVLNSFHIMGSARMGGSPSISACDPTGQTWDVRDLYVLDGSSFPTASGVNPQISIQAIAHMSARGLAARLA